MRAHLAPAACHMRARTSDMPLDSCHPDCADCCRYLCNRLVMYHVHSGTEGGAQELWRGSQAWIWMGA